MLLLSFYENVLQVPKTIKILPDVSLQSEVDILAK